MKRISCLSILCIVLLVAACQKKTAPQDTPKASLAEQRYQLALTLVEQGNWNQAKIELDSIHILYPKDVTVRRAANALNDSIIYLEALRTVQYTDSVLPLCIEQANKHLKLFRYEKQDRYEDQGHFVHKLLYTEQNRSRCFLQCYITEDRHTIMKSYYYGDYAFNQTSITLSTTINGLEISVSANGSNHCFEAEGVHEIMTLTEDDAIRCLEFIATYQNERVRVKIEGKSGYIYYLQDNEKQALGATYDLAVMMKNIRMLEEESNLAYAKKDWYENRKR